MSDAAANEDEALCTWCHQPGADDLADCEDGEVVFLHTGCIPSWAWNRIKERMN